jgi:hypothetical protein
MRIGKARDTETIRRLAVIYCPEIDNPEVGKLRRAILLVIRQLGNGRPAARLVEFKLLPVSITTTVWEAPKLRS